MRLLYTGRFRKRYRGAPETIQRACDKQLGFLLLNLQHPSLHAKKYDESNNIWQARVTRDWRLYFKIEGDAYVLLTLRPHPK